jgi:hypothetical protein
MAFGSMLGPGWAVVVHRVGGSAVQKHYNRGKMEFRLCAKRRSKKKEYPHDDFAMTVRQWHMPNLRSWGVNYQHSGKVLRIFSGSYLF